MNRLLRLIIESDYALKIELCLDLDYQSNTLSLPKTLLFKEVLPIVQGVRFPF